MIKLKSISKKVFAIQASSAETERHNSAAGVTISEIRNRLSNESLEQLVFLNEFYKNC